ncbi:MAG: transcription-repair coupling factor [bacterium]|nr:transcription-repair coupling factor [bacterium]
MELINFLLPKLNSPSLQRIVERSLRGFSTIVKAEPLSFPSIIAALLVQQSQFRSCKKIILVAENRLEADAIHDDANALLGKNVFLVSQREAFPGDVLGAPDNEKSERAIALQAFYQPDEKHVPALFVMPAVVLLEGISKPEPPIRFQVGDLLDPEELSETLVKAGFDRQTTATEPAEFARRGGIFDIYGWGQNQIVRIELDDIVIESIRFVDPITQRSIQEVNAASILINDPTQSSNEFLLDQINPNEAIFIFSDFTNIHFTWQDWEKSVQEREDLELPPYLSVEEVYSKLKHYTKVLFAPLELDKQIFQNLINGEEIQEVKIPYQPLGYYRGDLETLEGQYRNSKKQGWNCVLLCDTERQRERLYDLFEEKENSVLSEIPIGIPSIHHGFHLLDSKLVVYTEHQIFGRTRRRGRYKQFIPSKTEMKSIEGIRRGDYVVHIDHGIGRFEGLEKVRILDSEQECFRIVFAGGVSVLVRMENFSKIQLYRSEDPNPPLSRIGGSEWANARTRAKRMANEMAKQIINLYANRAIVQRPPLPPDGATQHEFEISFEYEETPDQLTATEEIKADLQKEQPMDRLLIGDVGFGKTEVAMRAAWKVVQENKQVAVICPTTVLAAQHGNTFRERFRFTGANIEVLSRFTYPKDVKRILEELKQGKIDILIGTHRLLSKDVQFKNLGLLIIDEEHKFGVRHKDELRKKRLEVDVLTLSATPIPRTLQMAISGVRDVSFIRTAPAERLPVETEVVAYDERIIKEAILREISRGGQVFFVHNRIETMPQMVEKLKQLLPNVSFAMAHAKLPPHQLEKIMLDFIQNKYHVLVSSMIIESGIDLPNVNTLIVNRADLLGLAQLYQLRGRIGRSNRQAYAWLLTPPESILSGNARKRLRTLQEFSNLGTGYEIALRDLEIRGAGNLLGKEQSGMITEVGLELYLEMLEEAIQQIREESKIVAQELETESTPIRIEFAGDAFLSSDYIEDIQERVEVYRRLEKMNERNEVLDIQAELKDRYGKIPKETERLLTIVNLRILAKKLKISTITVQRNSILLVANLGNVVPTAQDEKVLAWMNQFKSILDSKNAFVVTKPFGIQISKTLSQDFDDFIQRTINDLYFCCTSSQTDAVVQEIETKVVQ